MQGEGVQVQKQPKDRQQGRGETGKTRTLKSFRLASKERFTPDEGNANPKTKRKRERLVMLRVKRSETPAGFEDPAMGKQRRRRTELRKESG